MDLEAAATELCIVGLFIGFGQAGARTSPQPYKAANLTRSARRFVRRFARSERGGFGLWLGVAFPALSVLAFGAVELSEVSRERTRLQDTADAAVLMAARELSMGVTDGVEDRAEGFALNQLADVAARATVTADVKVSGAQATANLTSNRVGFFANMLPPGGFWTKVSAVAGSQTGEPLCVLGLVADGSMGPVINVANASSLQAGGCTVHSNHNLQVSSTSSTGVAAGKVTATGRATGTISPAPVNGASLVVDPFTGREFPYGSCAGQTVRLKTYDGGIQTVPEGRHCGGIQVEDETTLNLGPGVHYFEQGHLTLSQTSRLTGTNVVLVFGPGSKLNARGRSYVSLTGRESGPYAGMLIVATPTNDLPFEIFSNAVDRLEGVVYLPAAMLIVNGATAGEVAENSDWTVTVTKLLKIQGSAKLVIKTDYAASTVPLPATVGSSGGPVQLVR
jgi:Flp pilus assembly protein TadG